MEDSEASVHWDWTNMSNLTDMTDWSKMEVEDSEDLEDLEDTSKTKRIEVPEIVDNLEMLEDSKMFNWSTITDCSKPTTKPPSPPKDGYEGDVEDNVGDESTTK